MLVLRSATGSSSTAPSPAPGTAGGSAWRTAATWTALDPEWPAIPSGWSATRSTLRSSERRSLPSRSSRRPRSLQDTTSRGRPKEGSQGLGHGGGGLPTVAGLLFEALAEDTLKRLGDVGPVDAQGDGRVLQ